MASSFAEGLFKSLRSGLEKSEGGQKIGPLDLLELQLKQKQMEESERKRKEDIETANLRQAELSRLASQVSPEQLSISEQLGFKFPQTGTQQLFEQTLGPLAAFQKQQVSIGSQAQKRLDTITHKYNSNSSVKKYEESKGFSQEIRDLVNSGNPIAANALPRFLAKGTNEVGNLAAHDVAPYGGSAALSQKVKASFQMASRGTLTQDNARFMLELADILEKSNDRNLDRLSRKMAQQFKNKDTDEETIYKHLNPLGIFRYKFKYKNGSIHFHSPYDQVPADAKLIGGGE